MAIAIDGSTPASVNTTVSASAGGTLTTASFTAPANALLVACIATDGDSGGGTLPDPTIADSGGLTWTTRVQRLVSETTVGGGSGIFTARTVSSVSRTVTVTLGARTGSANWGSGRVFLKVYVLTGVDVDGTPVDTVTGSNEGGSSTNNLDTTTITPGGTGLLFAADCDWNALGSFQASSNLTQETAHFAGEISVCVGYRTTTVSVGASANLNASGTAAAQHKWCQINTREASGGATVFTKIAGSGGLAGVGGTIVGPGGLAG